MTCFNQPTNATLRQTVEQTISNGYSRFSFNNKTNDFHTIRVTRNRRLAGKRFGKPGSPTSRRGRLDTRTTDNSPPRPHRAAGLSSGKGHGGYLASLVHGVTSRARTLSYPRPEARGPRYPTTVDGRKIALYEHGRINNGTTGE